MSVLGSCNDLVANASFTFIYIDELTTVVSVQALAPFMADYAHIGSAPSSISGVGGAFQTASSEIDFSTGQLSFGEAALDLPYLNLNTMADILAACVNTAGGSSSCSTLFSNTGGTSDTIGAALAIARAPGHNTSQLYSLISSNSPFLPYFATVPSDYTSTVGFTFPSFVQTGALDSNGRLWLYFGGYNYDTGSDTSTASPGYIQVYDNNFNPLFTVNPGTGGLYYPSDMASDASGHVFAVNANNSVSEFDSNGNAISPAMGWSTGIASSFTPSQSGNGDPYNASQVGPIGVDALGNIWGAVPDDSGPGQNNCYFEMNSAGTVITPNGNFCGMNGNYSGFDAFDGSGNAWALGTSSISKVNAMGNLAVTAPTEQGCFYPSDSISGMPNPEQNFETITRSVIYDHAHNQLWGYSEVGAGAITDGGTSLFCNFGSSTLPVAQPTSTGSAAPGSPYSGNSVIITNAVLDGAGNLWFATGRSAESGVVGANQDTFTGTVNYSSYLSELSSSGNLTRHPVQRRKRHVRSAACRLWSERRFDHRNQRLRIFQRAERLSPWSRPLRQHLGRRHSIQQDPQGYRPRGPQHGQLLGFWPYRTPTSLPLARTAPGADLQGLEPL